MTRLRPLLPILFLLAVAAVAFSRLLRAQFVNWDDPSTIYENPHVNVPTLAGLGYVWTHPQGHLYVPLTYTAWWLTAFVARDPASPLGLSAGPYHALNLVLHLAATALAYRLLRNWFPPIASAFGAAVFALHPVQVESVAWASGTKDLLSATLALGALCVLFHNADISANGTPATRARRYVVPTLLFVASLLAKPSAVTLPLVGIAIHFWAGRRDSDAAATRIPRVHAVWLVLTTPFLVVGRLTQPASHAVFSVPLPARPAIAADALTFYLRKLLFPAGLAPDYGHSPLHALTQSPILATATLALLLAVAVFLLRRRFPTLALSAAIVTLCTLPVLGLIPFDFQIYSTVADHYLYLALLGPAFLLASITATWRFTRPLAAVVLSILAVTSFGQSRHWHDTVSLFSHTLAVNPRSTTAHVNSAIALAERNRAAEAESHYRAGLRLDFVHPGAHLGLGRCLAARNELLPALGHLTAATRLAPDDPAAHYNLALLLSVLNRPDDAIIHYERALALNPTFAEAHTNLATLLLDTGHPQRALGHYQRALDLNPTLQLPRLGLQAARQALTTQPAAGP